MALSQDNVHPFDDVPVWASPYVGYMYQKGLTNGISANEYGSQSYIDAKSYNLLKTNMKDSNYKLASSLVDQGVIDEKTVKRYGILEIEIVEDCFAS